MRARTGLNELPAYLVHEGEFVIKLDANERTTNLPSTVLKAGLERITNLDFNRYPEISMSVLRKKIADEFGFEKDNILIGNGSSQLLAAACYAFGGNKTSIIYPDPSFSMYNTYVKLADSTPVKVALNDNFGINPELILETAKSSNAGLIILCSPNNPTGNSIPLKDIETVLKHAECPVILDAAYCEFDENTVLPDINEYPNLIIARTFSKAYGLAGLRVGYMVGSAELIETISKSLMPYNVNAVSLAMAEAVFDRRHEFQADIIATIRERKILSDKLAAFPGIKVYPSKTNFILIKYDKSFELNNYLRTKQIAVRDFKPASILKDCLRITIGTKSENDILLQAIKDFQGENK